MFIQDLNRSSFNVGRQIHLQGFDMVSPGEVRALHGLVSGLPFLTGRVLGSW